MSMKFFYTFIILLFHFQLSAQPFYFEQYSSGDGLSSVFISDIVQDSTGFLWIGTQDGLNRFDGYSFKVYKNISNQSTSLNDNLVRSLHVDRKGKLWVGTRKGAARYNPILDNFIRLPGVLFGHQNNDKVRVLKILSDKRNHIWIAMQENGIFRYNPKTKQYRHFHTRSDEHSQINSNLITGMYYEESGDVLWFTSFNGGVQRIILPEGKVKDFKSINSEILDDNSIYSFYRVEERDTAFFWLQTYHKLYILPQHNFSPEYLKFHQLLTTDYHQNIKDVIQTGENEIWIGGPYLIRYNTEKEELLSVKHRICESASLSNDNINSLFFDSFDVLWVGTENGLNKMDTRQKAFTVYTETAESDFRLPIGEVQAIYQDSHGTLWIGLRKNGLYLIKGNQRKHIHYQDGNFPGFTGNNITSFCEDAQGRIWIGIMGGGLNMIENPERVWENEFSFQYFRKNQNENQYLNTWNVRCITPEDELSFWIGTLNGISHVTFKEQNGKLVIDAVKNYQHTSDDSTSLIGNLVNDIYIDKQKNVWVATSQGLSLLTYKNRGTGEFKNFFPDSEQAEISQNSVKKIVKSNNETLWFATQGGGLFKYNMKLNKFTNYSIEKGLSASIIWGIQKDRNNNLWLSTNEGLWLFNIEKNTFRRYTASDGLRNIEFSEFSSFKNKNGEMFFGGKNGLIRFHPDSIEDNPFPPKVVISRLRIFNQSIDVGDTLNGKLILDSAITQKRKLTLTHKHNDFSFEFIGLHFAAPEQNKYAYIMEGYDRNWKYTGAKNRIATYTNLPPGKYIFKVKASNNDGVWNQNPSSIVVEVLPPFWLTWWAYLIYFIIIAGIFFLLLHFVRLRQKWQNELELDKIKLHFFTNISHEFRTPLTLILGPLDNLLKQTTGHESTIKMIKNNALRLQQLINQLLDIRKLEQGTNVIEPEPINIVKFTENIVDMFFSVAKQENYNLSFKSAKNSHIINFDKDKLEKVLINIISNAFKYTPSGGEISIKIDFSQKNYVAISVTDSGIGISKKNHTRIFERFYRAGQTSVDGFGIGLALSYQLVKLHKGKIEVESRPGKGSCFTVLIPDHLPAVKKTTKLKNTGQQTTASVIEPADETVDVPPNFNHNSPLLLVIDDNADMRHYIRNNLSEKYQIVLAENGKTGIKKAMELIPDLIISDVMMPEMDGYELSSKLKNDLRTSHIPVILLTARQSDQSHKSGLKTGADDYITKPFDMEILHLRIYNLLENRQRVHRFFSKDKRKINVEDLDVGSYDKNFLAKAFKIVDANIENENFSVEEFARQIALSRTQLYRKLKALTGKTPIQLIKISRMTKAAELLKEKQMTVSEVAHKTGFKDIAHFSRSFLKYYGKNPSDYGR